MREERRPPYSEDAEEAVLAAVMIDPSCILPVLEIMDHSAFYTERHRRLFKAMTSLAETGTTIDPVTLAERLERSNELTSAGGRDYIGYLVDAAPDALNVVHHANIISEKARLRRVIEAGQLMVSEAFRADRPSSDIARDGLSSLVGLSVESSNAGGFRLVRDDIWPVMEEIEARALGKVLSCLTGWSQIDRETGGFNPGELVIVGGAEGMGKSAFALNIALRVAQRTLDEGGGGVGYVSAEMSKTALVKRCLAWCARIDGRKLRSGDLRDDDFPKLAHGAGILQATPLWIDEQAEPSLGDVVAKCTALKAANPTIRLILVDFLQLVRLRGSEQNRNEQLTEIAYALKGLAKRLEVVAVAPCQVNTKEVEKGSDMRPQPRDLQGSSGMRQAADFLALLYRHGYYDPTHDARDFEVNFAKCRDASPFLARLRWDGPTLSIDDPSTVRPRLVG